MFATGINRLVKTAKMERWGYVTPANRSAMPITTMSSREFNQDASRAKKAANAGPIFITDRGEPAHVLLSIEEYLRLTGGETRVAFDAITDPSRVIPAPAGMTAGVSRGRNAVHVLFGLSKVSVVLPQ